MKHLRLPAILLLAGCASAVGGALPDRTTTAPPPPTVVAVPSTPGTSTASTSAPAVSSSPTTLPPGVTQPPSWLGSRPLEVGPDGNPASAPTPPELSDRRFTTVDRLPPPPQDRFVSTVGPVPADVAARSTWEEGCPVSLEELAYVTASFRGFDGLAHTGELLVAEEAADDMVSVFEQLFVAGFPIEEMRITSPGDLDLVPTGDGNPTSSFVCRPVTGGSGWSEHARGLAIDINPFHNPYLKDERVIPELAGDYLDRERLLPGMIVEGDVVTGAFDSVGWEWGGRWSTLKDYQHFSLTGR